MTAPVAVPDSLRSLRRRFTRAASALLLTAVLTRPVAAQATPVAAPAAATSADREVMAVITRLFDGMRQGDSSMVRSVFDSRARMITVAARNGAPRVTVESGVDAFVKAVGTPHADVWDERIANPRVQIDGDLASVWVDYAFFAGPRFSHCGVDHVLLTRGETGRWLILELADTRRTTGCERWTRPA